jgi:Flp pilus assembly protein TadG
MLELALFILPTLGMLFAFIDIGLLLFTWITLQNAVREGCRYAITYQTDSSGTQIQSIKDAVANAAMGLVSSSANVNTGSATPYVRVYFYTPPTTSSATETLVTGTGSNASGNIVQVSIQNYPYTFLAPLSGSLGYYSPTWTGSAPLTLQVYSVDVLGGAPSNILPTVGTN